MRTPSVLEPQYCSFLLQKSVPEVYRYTLRIICKMFMKTCEGSGQCFAEKLTYKNLL